MVVSLSALNQMNQAAFVEVCGAVFEETPEIAAQAWIDRPFADVADLHQKMVAIVDRLTPDAKLALIRAHPDLGARVKMAAASVKEQMGAGLDRLTPEEFEQFQILNQRYKARFQIPFIIAVKNHTKATILEAFHRRLEHTVEAEIDQALQEITVIARFRLLDLVLSP
jgi:2-oxo-4-hydroxy-4-carboxy-5-ureidoimidazoline decarboxylase